MAGHRLRDVDHDGALDLAIVNGRVSASPEKNTDATLGAFWSRYAERNQLFANEGDGALNLLVTTLGGPSRLYRNVAPKRGHWLLVRLIDPALRRNAYGARIRVQAGDRRWVGIVNPAKSYLRSCDARVHFGLGQATHVDSITVDWPDGSQELFAGVAVDGSVLLRKREVKPSKGVDM